MLNDAASLVLQPEVRTLAATQGRFDVGPVDEAAAARLLQAMVDGLPRLQIRTLDSLFVSLASGLGPSSGVPVAVRLADEETAADVLREAIGRAIAEVDEDEEPVDPKIAIDEKCSKSTACSKAFVEYEACAGRIEKKGHGECSGQYMDYLACIDACVRCSFFRARAIFAPRAILRDRALTATAHLHRSPATAPTLTRHRATTRRRAARCWRPSSDGRARP